MHAMMRLSVRRHGDEFVDEPIAVAHVYRISPRVEGEGSGFGCRVYLVNQSVSLMVKQTADEVMDLMVRAQVDLAMACVPTYTAELVGEPTETVDDAYRRGLQKTRDVLLPHLTVLRDLITGPVDPERTLNEQYDEMCVAIRNLLNETSAKPVSSAVRQGAVGVQRYTFTETTKWQHVRRGTHYALIGFASVQSDVSINEGDNVAVYVALGADGCAEDKAKIFVRPTQEFLDGRFTRHGAKEAGHAQD